MEKNVRMAILFDYYGEMLTEKQKEYFDLYYGENLSLSEIAENDGISRQGVRDVIVRAEGIMTDLEEKTGIIKRFKAMQPHVTAICDAVDGLLSSPALLTYPDPKLEATLRCIKADAEALKE